MKAINLLPKRRVSLVDTRINAVFQKFFMIAIIYATLCAIFISIVHISAATVVQDEQRLQTLTNEIAQKRTTAIELVTAKTRIRAITAILNKQYPFTSVIQTLYTLITPETQLESVHIDSSGNVQMELLAINSTAIASFSAQLQAAKNTYHIQNIMLENAFMDNPGAQSYKMNVQFTLPKNIPSL